MAISRLSHARLVLCLLASKPAAVWGQVPVSVLDSSASCAKCSIRVERIAHLSDARAEINGGARNISTIDRDSRGRLWVTDFGNRTGVLVFDSLGTFIRKIGRAGSGPGEFRNATAVLVGRHDTVHVFDPSNGRRSVISPTNLRVVDSKPYSSWGINALERPNGNFVENHTTMSDASGFGVTLAEFSPAGERIRAFGGDNEPYFNWMSRFLDRRLAEDGSGGLYAVHTREYVIDQFGSAGELLRRWERKVDWFPPEPRTIRKPNASEGLPPQVFSVWRDNSTQLMYVASHVRQRDWQRAVVVRKAENGAPLPVIDDEDKYWDTIIEAFDLTSGRLVKSARLDQYFPAGGRHGLLYLKGYEPEDYIDVYRVRLIRP